MTAWSEDFGSRMRNILSRFAKLPAPAMSNFAEYQELAARLEERIIASSDIIGPRGPQGQTGPIGATGAPGPIGPIGPAGVTGPAGPQGIQGIKGDTGLVGPIGPPGAAGPAGPQGIKGDTGLSGSVGPTGPAGAMGPAGGQGIQGIKGDTGDVGPSGAIGPAGPQGMQGIKGDTGFIGPAGAIGPQGIQGTQGATGLAGPTGAQGPIGLTGATGPAGSTGATGPAGLQGPIGLTGPAGAQGIQGIQGVQGPTGPTALAHAIRAASPKIAGATTSLALTTLALTAARQYFIPFVVAKTVTLTALRTTITTALAGTLSFGIYSNATLSGDDVPGTLLASSTGQSSGTTGDKTGAVAITLTAGTLFWVSVICSAAATLRAVAIGGTATSLGFTVGATTAVTHLFVAGSGSTLPGTAPGGLTEGTTAVPAVYLVGS